MRAKVGTCAVVGLGGALAGAGMDAGPGQRAVSISGQPDTAVTEAKGGRL